MAKCKHGDCFTCPYKDCIATERGIHSISKPKFYDGKKGEYTIKQAPAIRFQSKGLKE